MVTEAAKRTRAIAGIKNVSCFVCKRTAQSAMKRSEHLIRLVVVPTNCHPTCLPTVAPPISQACLSVGLSLCDSVCPLGALSFHHHPRPNHRAPLPHPHLLSRAKSIANKSCAKRPVVALPEAEASSPIDWQQPCQHKPTTCIRP